MADLIQLAFVPGILSLCGPWSGALPAGLKLAPVEWHPSGADDPTATGRSFGEPGDLVEVAALRLLVVAVQFSVAGTPWALACHSAGGAVVYRCLDLLGDLVRYPNATEAIAESSRLWLPPGEAQILVDDLMVLKGRPLKLPIAVLSFEGTLMPCDVKGWAEEWSNTSTCPRDDWVKKALADPSSSWTWPMARACSGSLWEQCAVEKPPRHLASIEQWLRLPGSPGFVYVAGEKSSKRNQIVFPALRRVADSSGYPDKLMIEEVPTSGHNLHRDAPDAVKAILKDVILQRSPSAPMSWSHVLQGSISEPMSQNDASTFSLFSGIGNFGVISLLVGILVVASFLILGFKLGSQYSSVPSKQDESLTEFGTASSVTASSAMVSNSPSKSASSAGTASVTASPASLRGSPGPHQ